MNLRDLEYLVALADFGHFGKAAQHCFVSQPALSMQIKKLEATLGIKLIERTNKSVLLTEHGRIIAERSRQILNEIQELKDIARFSLDPLQGELKIGIFPTLAPYLLPIIIPNLSKTYPKLSLYLIEEKTALLIEQLKNGKLDAALLALPIEDNSFTIKTLFDEEFFLATPKKHSLAQNKFVTASQLTQQNVLLLEEGHCMRDQALTICQKLTTDDNQNFRATSLETLRHMVISGIGITLIPKLACFKNENLCYLPFKSPKPSRTIGLIFRKESVKHVLLSEIAKKIKTLTTDALKN